MPFWWKKQLNLKLVGIQRVFTKQIAQLKCVDFHDDISINDLKTSYKVMASWDIDILCNFTIVFALI